MGYKKQSQSPARMSLRTVGLNPNIPSSLAIDVAIRAELRRLSGTSDSPPAAIPVTRISSSICLVALKHTFIPLLRVSSVASKTSQCRSPMMDPGSGKASGSIRLSGTSASYGHNMGIRTPSDGGGSLSRSRKDGAYLLGGAWCLPARAGCSLPPP